MIAIDTNILARFITLDDAKQAEIAIKLILKQNGINKSIYIDNIVLCELCWLLKNGYKYSSSQIYDVIKLIVSIEEFKFSSASALKTALLSFNEHLGDFADYLIYHMAKNNGCVVYSFDQKMIKNGFFVEACETDNQV